ncbi:hypothetical protein PGT21_011032 [Puccinia graminis f. sp. tritici]|uniref:Uncharacterized protein n=1 Tax=Puccinia graminis f. sp. tritici TaxID=56615 RepID=A0A5B0MTL4_PUCGR|nr:hypothetical protein PGT21_011032 [Puccinia graminis f. sp. tritici]
MNTHPSSAAAADFGISLEPPVSPPNRDKSRYVFGGPVTYIKRSFWNRHGLPTEHVIDISTKYVSSLFLKKTSQIMNGEIFASNIRVDDPEDPRAIREFLYIAALFHDDDDDEKEREVKVQPATLVLGVAILFPICTSTEDHTT